MKRIISISIMICFAANSWAGAPEKEQPVEPFDRGIGTSTTVFVPKGTVSTGVNFSYTTIDLGQAADDPGYSLLFDLVNGLKGSMYSFGLAPHLSYFVADNLSIGARFDYDRSSLDIGNIALSLGDDLGFGISDYHMLKHMYSPIGIEIQAETPEEIAVSVTAQMILHRAQRSEG